MRQNHQGFGMGELRRAKVALVTMAVVVVMILIGCQERKPSTAKKKEPTQAAESETAVPGETQAPGAPKTNGAELYAQHCVACHGKDGDGKGIAALFLFPKPRDFRAGRFRLVSTANGIPTQEDILAVLRRGMPGSSMPPWVHLGDDALKALTEHVFSLRREGVRDILKAVAEDSGDELSEEDLKAAIERLTTPGDIVQTPDLSQAPTAEALAHGKDLYATKGCVQCHGATGKGDGTQQMIDAEGLPTRPRDLTQGIYKGSPDPASVWRRTMTGMPGSPMPSSQNLTPQDVSDLTHYVLSMSDEATRGQTVLVREKLEARRMKKLPELVDEAAWQESSPVGIRTTPLWWRDEADRDLKVQAAHDGKTLAVRISWNDETQDAAAIRPDQFEDMVAAEFYQGPAEPFLGMGAVNAVIDLWQWRAGTHDTGTSDQQSDDYPFDTVVYKELAKGKPLPDFLTARVVGNPLATRETDGASLEAIGPGSVTFLPRASQLVESESAWKDGRWTVMLRRPMEANKGSGIAIHPNGHYSIAFALWDGSLRDRGPQKRITLWNDLIVK